MTNGQTQVADFMRFFGQATPDKPVQLDEETSKLRAQLILEEALETITKGLGLAVGLQDRNGNTVVITEANLSYWLTYKEHEPIKYIKQKEVDLVELADGLADLAYVGEFGTAVAAGIDLEPIQDEVHRSNMTKAWTAADLEAGKKAHPTAVVEDYGGGLYRLVRSDGKVIKSPSYKPADIAPLIEAQK